MSLWFLNMAQNQQQFILASASPRRREILAGLGVDLQVLPSQIDETLQAGESPPSYVQRLAREKARDISRKLAQGIVIGADTVVVLDSRILGKPTDADDARAMLAALANQWHTVFTGVAVINCHDGQEKVDYCATRVKFTPLSDEEIEWYIKSGEPFDKAGAYAIQGLGTIFIEAIEGNYLNVVGLPVTLLRRMVASLGVRLI